MRIATQMCHVHHDTIVDCAVMFQGTQISENVNWTEILRNTCRRYQHIIVMAIDIADQSC
jgi:hypothetical protein